MDEVSTLKVRNVFVENSNFSYETIDLEMWNNGRLNNSLFNGTVMNGCFITEMIFDNTDFEGTRFINCCFVRCRFHSADLRSTWAKNCSFEQCSFNDSIISDSSFLQCKFDTSTYDGFALSNSTFAECEFIRFTPSDSSVLLCKFSDTKFSDSIFNKTFYYHIFIECEFSRSSFEAYLLGFVYGLTEQNYEELTPLLMGESIDVSLGKCASEVAHIYDTRKMYLNMGVLALGQIGCSTDSTLLKCIDLLEKMIDLNIIVKLDQLHYLEMLIEYLDSGKSISPAVFILMHNHLEAMIERQNKTKNTSWEKSNSDVTALRNKVYFLLLAHLDNLKPRFLNHNSYNPATLKFSFAKKPTMDTVNLLSSLAPELSPIKQVRTEEGSFYEWILSPENIITVLDMFLKLVSSVAIPVVTVYLKDRLEKKKDKPSNSELPAPSGDLTIPQPRLPDQNATIQIQHTMQVILDLRILDDPEKFGFSSKNLQKIEVTFTGVNHSNA